MVPAGGASQLAFVGPSQGTTQLLAALASSPALRPKLAFAALLAPAVHMRSIRSPPLQVLADLNADQARKPAALRRHAMRCAACKACTLLLLRSHGAFSYFAAV